MLAKHAVLEALRAQGIRHIFGNPGTTELNLLDALAEYPDITYVLGLQDNVPMGMAYGYAAITGRPAFVNLHVTPGLANAMGNLYNAYRAGVPVIVTAGQIDSRLSFHEPLLWSDLVRLASPLVKWAYEPKRGEEVPAALARAFKVATTPPPGPVFLSLPTNVLDEPCRGPMPMPAVEARVLAHPEAVARAARLLADATSPVIITGASIGKNGALDALVRVAETVGARVLVERIPSRTAFPTGHPLYFGSMGFTREQMAASLEGADLLLVAGASRIVPVVYGGEIPVPEGARLLQVDVDPWEVGKSLPVDVGIVADLPGTLADLADAVARTASADQRTRIGARLAALRERNAALRRGWGDAAPPLPTEGPVTLGTCLREIAAWVDGSTTVVEECTTAARVQDRYLPLNAAESFFGIAGGALGLGLPASLGVKLARPDRRVICLVGDGSILYAIQALWTAARHRIGVVILVLNNRSYRILREAMEHYKGGPVPDERLIGVHLDAPAVDHVAVSQGFGVPARRVVHGRELRGALEEAFAAQGPVLVDIAIA
ncbi:MAG: hypothetical protein HY660_11225 [Armatimonadetes bacterium]|nr:hypothetical protein [Armatimonadota bacterium]